LENELRDTQGDWFYWAFCVEGAQGKTLTFHFSVDRLGYFGPAISHDLKTWRWQKDKDGFAVETAFTYTFGDREEKVYFAHDMLYHPDYFLRFAKENGLMVEEFCKSQKGRIVPCVKIGEGSRSVILTSRHHACEATGNYVLEGVLLELLKNPVPDTKILCVPFVDYDGVVDGDQGKNRAPYDHNRDYTNEPIYSTVRTLKNIVDTEKVVGAFDFHAPWHYGGDHDFVFIVRNNPDKTDLYERFGCMLEENLTPNCLRYERKNDTNWQHETHSQFAGYTDRKQGCIVSFSLETTYFGESDNVFTQDKAIEFGKVFGEVALQFLREQEK
jgi:hypothetical protein